MKIIIQKITQIHQKLSAIIRRFLSAKNPPPATYRLPPSRGFTLLNPAKREFRQRRNYLTGFTLIETLVAISILMIAVASPLTIAQKGLSSAIYAKDQVTAAYLAQDAIEYIINWSGQNIIKNPAAGWLNGIIALNSQCSALCIIDTRKQYGDMEGIQTCLAGVCPPLQYDTETNRYGYNSGWADSPFTRSVTVTEPNPGKEALIQVNISWTSKNTQRSLDFYTRIFNWHS